MQNNVLSSINKKLLKQYILPFVRFYMFYMFFLKLVGKADVLEKAPVEGKRNCVDARRFLLKPQLGNSSKVKPITQSKLSLETRELSCFHPCDRKGFFLTQSCRKVMNSGGGMGTIISPGQLVAEFIC